MADFYETALAECRAELRQTVTYLNGRSSKPVTASDALIERFIKKFARDFKLALTPRGLRGKAIRKGTANERIAAAFAPVAWSATRDAVMVKAVAIATLATSYAQQRGDGAITEDDLMRALRRVKAECSIRTDEEPQRRKRWDYCWGVL